MDLSKITNRQLLIIFSIIFILAISIFVLITINLKEMNQCLENPMVYGAISISEKYGDVMCSCSVSPDIGADGSMKRYASFMFDKNGIEFEKPLNNPSYSNINFDNIKIIEDD